MLKVKKSSKVYTPDFSIVISLGNSVDNLHSKPKMYTTFANLLTLFMTKLARHCRLQC